MKTLITGASGLLGAELCTQLKDLGHEIWAVDNHSRSEIIPECDHWLRLDLSDPDSYRSLPQDFNWISAFHRYDRIEFGRGKCCSFSVVSHDLR